MLHYAQCDTHYLLFIYDKLRQALLEQGATVPEDYQIPLREGAPEVKGGISRQPSWLCTSFWLLLLLLDTFGSLVF